MRKPPDTDREAAVTPCDECPGAAALRDRLASGVVLGDGALGTYLFEQGYDIGHGAEALVLSRPDAVQRVHVAYREAGAELLETNTFAANRLRLAGFGLADRVAELNRIAVGLARAAAGADGWVSGAVGPVPVTPSDDIWDAASVRSAYDEQVAALVEAGVDALHLETFGDLRVLRIALEAARAGTAGRGTVLIAQMVFDDGACLASGEPADDAARALWDAGADVVGVNCGRGLSGLRAALAGVLAAAAGRPVSAYPNAGYPERLGGRTLYLAAPAYLAAQLAPLVRRGVRLVGGCCGTTPDTIRALRQMTASLRRAPRTAAGAPLGAPAPAATAGAAASGMRPGAFLDGLHGPLPILAEIDPPPHLEWSPVAEGARALVAAGADAISLAENPLASIRLSNIFLGAWLRREAGLQVVCHMTGRDRNALGLQSELMGAHAAGIRAILAVTGDPTRRDDHGGAASVYEVNSVGLVRILAALNRGVTTAGRAIRGETDFSIGVAFNGSAADLTAEIGRLRRKRDEGAQFVMTQPVFETDQGRRVLDAVRGVGLRVFLGFLPPVSSRLAEYLHNEVPGISVPEALRRQLAALPAAEDQERAGLDHARELLDALARDLDGVYLITPGSRWRCLPPLIERVLALRAARGLP